MAITMRMVALAWIFFATEVTQGPLSIVKCPLYAHQTHTKLAKLHVAQSAFAVALQFEDATNNQNAPA
jgi:hypothetical protein